MNLVAQELDKDFGLYHVLGVLGDGSMGRMYLAERRTERREPKGSVGVAALKSFHPELVQNVRLRNNLSETARRVAELVHPGIVATFEVGEVEGRLFLAMEYLPGDNLANVLASGATAPGAAAGPAKAALMPPEVAATLVQQCLEGLGRAHELAISAEGQVHGLRPDVRPAHIFVTYQGAAKLLGCAESILCGDGLELRGAARGGLAYTAPEALDARTPQALADPRAAIFSMGVVLWECVTGRQLFAADGPTKTTEAVRSRYIEPPSVFRPDAPPGLDEVVLRATSRDPRRRYQSAREMSQALDKVLATRRPSPEIVGSWLEGRFGVERASIKKQIARGVSVDAALVRLRLLGDVAPLPAGALATSAIPLPPLPEAPAHLPPASARPSGRNLRVAAVLGGVVVAVVIGAVMFSQDVSGPAKLQPAAQAGIGALQISSTPPGAQILIDGDPSGFVTPARINGLRAGRKVEIRVDKLGFRAAAQTANIPLGGPLVLSFPLEESTGRVLLEGISLDATTYVDDAKVDVRQPLSLSVGAHRLRVEVSGRLLGAMKLDVQPGEHTVHVRPFEATDR